MTHSSVEFVLWISVTAVALHYVGYPLAVFALSVFSSAKADLSYLFSRHDRRCAQSAEYQPAVAVLMSAYNEELVIQAKVKNTLEVDYPPERLDILFGLDAPTDATVARLNEAAPDRIRVFPFATRRGKLAVLKELVEQTSAEILVLTDVNTMLDRRCVRKLVRHFANPRVGAVSGEEIRVAASSGDSSGESFYWRFESALKILESRLNCSLGGNGAVLAVRRLLFRPRMNSIVEDFQVPLEIRFNGHCVLYDPEAIAVEEITPTLSAQFRRRMRIASGNYQTLFENLRYLHPRNGLLALAYFFHRVLRWLAPLFLMIAFACSLWMAATPLYAGLAAAQIAFYGMAAAGYRRASLGRSAGKFSVPLQFCMMNLALLVGLIRYIGRKQSTAWTPTPRAVPAVNVLERNRT